MRAHSDQLGFFFFLFSFPDFLQLTWITLIEKNHFRDSWWSHTVKVIGSHPSDSPWIVPRQHFSARGTHWRTWPSWSAPQYTHFPEPWQEDRGYLRKAHLQKQQEMVKIPVQRRSWDSGSCSTLCGPSATQSTHPGDPPTVTLAQHSSNWLEFLPWLKLV